MVRRVGFMHGSGGVSSIRSEMQMDGAGRQGTIRTAKLILVDEGVSGLYRGLMAAVTYGSVRIGLYESIKDQAQTNNITLSAPLLALMAAASGFVGAMFGTPSDIANIRMQNDRSLPPALRRNYRHVFDAWVQMKRTEGWGGDHPVLHVSASLLASLVATTLCSPMDVIKTQLMGSSGQGSSLKVIRELTRMEGPRWLFRGWTPSFVRLGPQTMATLVLLEQHKRLYRVFTGRE
ncbi:hypothetical protein CDV55_100708 [Aspergillus turcosus]|nr:hypothetical protein CDV55_100708 [Aspergillus turcosus]